LIFISLHEIIDSEIITILAKEVSMRDVFYEETDCTVYWDSDNNWIYVDWRNSPKVQTVKNGCEEMLKLLKKKSCSRVLNDNSNVTGQWSAATEWVAESWFPRMAAAGLKKFAWIQSPHSALSKQSARQSVKKSESEEMVKMFENGDDAAVAWLKS
jgi:hypothetical protein